MRQTIHSHSSPHSPQAGVPPPPLDIELVDAGRTVGWIADARIGFRGFASDTEAVHAAWVAWRELERRAARRFGVRPVPVDAEPLSIRRSHNGETILAGSRPIGILLRPGADARTGRDAFAFELQLPASTGELALRAKAYVIYRGLRKSGVRWALWRPVVTPPPATITETSSARASLERSPIAEAVAAVATTDPATVRRIDDAAAPNDGKPAGGVDAPRTRDLHRDRGRRRIGVARDGVADPDRATRALPALTRSRRPTTRSSRQAQCPQERARRGRFGRARAGRHARLRRRDVAPAGDARTVGAAAVNDWLRFDDPCNTCVPVRRRWISHSTTHPKEAIS